MKRSTWQGAVTVVRWGSASRFADQIPDAALAQLRLAHDLRNDLVAIERRHEEVKAAIWETCPQIAEAERTLAEADEAVRAVKEVAKRERQADRTTRSRTETTEALRDARATFKAAKEARKAVRDEHYPALAPLFHDAKAARNGAVKALYGVFVQGRGLYWATYNSVVAHHDTAVQRMVAKRKAGEKAEMRFHRWSGEGTLSVQLQREAGDPERTPELLASCASKWHNVVSIPALPANFAEMSRGDQRRAARQVVKIKIGSTEDRSPVWWEIPVVMHRPLPAGADVTNVEVTRRRLAGHFALSVAVTCRIAAPVARSDGPVVGLDVGWRARSDGSLRVGVFQVDGQMPKLPAHPCIRPLQGGVEVVVPASWREMYERLEKLNSMRDVAFDTARDNLATWLEGRSDVSEAWETDPHVLRQWRSPARLAALALRWRDARVTGDGDAFAALEAWRVQDRHLWEWERNERLQLIGRRNDAWRVVGAWVASFAATLRLGAWHITSVRRRPDVGTEDDEQARAARHNATVAAPGALRAAVVAAAQREGATIEQGDPAWLGTTHVTCGAEAADRDEAAARITLWCETCQVGFDQDVNAARWLASARVPDVPR